MSNVPTQNAGSEKSMNNPVEVILSKICPRFTADQTPNGTASKNAKMILERVGLSNEFDIIIDGTKITKSKPDPEVFLNGAAELGFLPYECIVFEDAVAGVESGKRAGMKVIGIGKAEVLTKADIVLAGFEKLELKDLLSKI